MFHSFLKKKKGGKAINSSNSSRRHTKVVVESDFCKHRIVGIIFVFRWLARMRSYFKNISSLFLPLVSVSLFAFLNCSINVKFKHRFISLPSHYSVSPWCGMCCLSYLRIIIAFRPFEEAPISWRVRRRIKILKYARLFVMYCPLRSLFRV